jgi:hypothetical protein
MRQPPEQPAAHLVAYLAALTLLTASAATSSASASVRMEAQLTAASADRVRLFGKQRADRDWDAKVEIDELPCAGRHKLRLVTRYGGDMPNRHARYRLKIAAPILKSGKARCGRPIPPRYGNRRVTVSLRKRGAPGSVEFQMTGKRRWRGGPFNVRLSFQLICSGRYALRIRMDGPRAPLRIRYPARVSDPRIEGMDLCGT